MSSRLVELQTFYVPRIYAFESTGYTFEQMLKQGKHMGKNFTVEDCARLSLCSNLYVSGVVERFYV